jgi:uncharacterized membrane protein
MTQNSLPNKKEQTKEIIIETVRKKNPQTTHELITIVSRNTNLTEKEITNHIIELEIENRLHFAKKENIFKSTSRIHLFYTQTTWYWLICTIAILNTVLVFTISEKSSLILMRSALGLVFVLFLPGYAFMKILFPQNLPIQTNNKNIDNIERFALSIILSIVLTSIIGLILNQTTWGITSISITLSLLSLTISLATVAIIREKQTNQ